MRILLTGSTGLLGSHLLEQGLKKDYHFILPYRTINRRSYLASVDKHQNINLVDINEDWPDHLFENIDIIIHCAGFASPFEKDQKKMEEVNVELTKFIYQKKGTAKFIHISSIATLCSGREDYTVSEEKPGATRETYYAQSKKRSEQWLEQQNDEDLLIIHPCYLLGKYDARPSSGSIFFALKMGKIDDYINSTKNFVAASDVAEGIYQALEKNVSGHYILGGENIPLKYFFKQAYLKLQQENHLLEVPSSDSSLVQEFCTAGPVSFQKAMDDFEYNPLVNLQSMIDETIDYFCDTKMLRLKPKRKKIEENQ